MIDASIRSAWCAWTKQWEGRERTLYQDEIGLCTTGLGYELTDLAASQRLWWRRPTGALATPDEVAADWARVRAMPRGLAAGEYATPDALVLDDADIDALCLARLDGDVAALERRWPAFDRFPIGAQWALGSMSYALGAGALRPGLLSPEWPHLQAAVDAQDWRKAAQQCWMQGAGLAGRNAANVALFMAAARTS